MTYLKVISRKISAEIEKNHNRPQFNSINRFKLNLYTIFINIIGKIVNDAF